MKISGVYQIINTITGDCYIGSSVNLYRREKEHFRESFWKNEPNKQLYKDMKQYGKNNFLFKPILLCNPEELKKYEQIAIEKYNPKYNVCAAYTGMSKEEYIKQYRKEHADSIKKHQKQYNKQWYKEHADNIKQHQKQYNNEHADSIKQYQKQYYKEHADSIKQYYKEHADSIKQYQKQYYKEHADSIKQYYKEHADSIKQYHNQQCLYENELLTLNALRLRFSKKGIKNPTLEAKKYLIKLP